MSKGRWPTIKALVGVKYPTSVIQVGAHNGEEIRAFKSLWPLVSVWCFEPRADAFKLMISQWGDVSDVHLINMAVSKTQGLTKLHINRQEGTSSLLQINTESEHYLPKYETLAIIDVPTVTLDAFCEEWGLRKINLLMIDVQGGELDVLKGAAGLLERGAIDVIYTEVFFIDLYKDCPQFADVNRYLNDFGYRFVKFFNFGEALGKPPTLWSDALFVKGDRNDG